MPNIVPNIDDLSIALVVAVARREKTATPPPKTTGALASSPNPPNGRMHFEQARGGVIGRDLSLPWHLPADLARFRELTLGKTIIMGRRTYESIGRALDRRTNIVVSSRAGFEAKGCITCLSFEKALEEAASQTPGGLAETTIADDNLRPPDILIIGGESIYRQALLFARRIYLTLVDIDISGDTYFPDFDADAWHENESREYEADARNPHASCFFDLLRKPSPAHRSDSLR